MPAPKPFYVTRGKSSYNVHHVINGIISSHSTKRAAQAKANKLNAPWGIPKKKLPKRDKNRVKRVSTPAQLAGLEKARATKAAKRRGYAAPPAGSFRME